MWSYIIRSRSFYDFLVGAKEKIDNALMFVSWDALLNHAQAKDGIALFSSETVKYQLLVSAYDAAMQVNLLNGLKLESLIRFSSEIIARQAFNQMMTLVDKNIHYAEQRILETRDLKESFIHRVRSFSELK